MSTIVETVKATGQLNIKVTSASGQVKENIVVPNLVVSSNTIVNGNIIPNANVFEREGK
jgi:hypothetical protein